MKPVEQVLKDAGVKKDEIDDVCIACIVSCAS
jgi:molecular chaperone DnaK (HSP70)